MERFESKFPQLFVNYAMAFGLWKAGGPKEPIETKRALGTKPAHCSRISKQLAPSVPNATTGVLARVGMMHQGGLLGVDDPPGSRLFIVCGRSVEVSPLPLSACTMKHCELRMPRSASLSCLLRRMRR